MVANQCLLYHFYSQGSSPQSQGGRLGVQVSQPSLTPLNSLGHFSILARVMNANPLHTAMLMVSSPYRKPLVRRRGTNPPTLEFRTHRSIGNQWCDVDFHPWKSNLKLIITLPEQHYNNLSHTRQLCLHSGPMAMEAVPFGLGWVRPHHLTHISL